VTVFLQGESVEVCRDHRCPHRWREGRIDRKARKRWTEGP
jgi:hypothetical protein